MSNRLELLSLKRAPAKPGLKFKPKSVARKSKADLDKNAPEIKVEDKPRLQHPTAGRGGTRGRGRGRGGAYAGTHMVSAGPLAMGSVGMGVVPSRSKTGLTADRVYGASAERLDSPSGLPRIKQKDKANAEDSDSDDDMTRINMSKDYVFEDAQTALFPVRPQRDLALMVEPGLAYGNGLGSSREATVEPLKLEDEAEPKQAPVCPESLKFLDAQRSIGDMIARFDEMTTDEPEYFTMYLPQVVPPDYKQPEPAAFGLGVPDFEGQIGNFNIHKLGKVTITLLDGTVLECAEGAHSEFLQDLFVIDAAEPESELLDADGVRIAGNIHRLGNVSAKILATPTIQE